MEKIVLRGDETLFIEERSSTDPVSKDQKSSILETFRILSYR